MEAREGRLSTGSVRSISAVFFCKQKTDILKEGGSFTMAVGCKGFAIKEFLMRSFQRKSRDVSVTYGVAHHDLEGLKEMDIVGERILDIVGKRILG